MLSSSNLVPRLSPKTEGESGNEATLAPSSGTREKILRQLRPNKLTVWKNKLEIYFLPPVYFLMIETHFSLSFFLQVFNVTVTLLPV